MLNLIDDFHKGQLVFHVMMREEKFEIFKWLTTKLIFIKFYNIKKIFWGSLARKFSILGGLFLLIIEVSFLRMKKKEILPKYFFVRTTNSQKLTSTTCHLEIKTLKKSFLITRFHYEILFLLRKSIHRKNKFKYTHYKSDQKTKFSSKKQKLIFISFFFVELKIIFMPHTRLNLLKTRCHTVYWIFKKYKKNY